MGIATQQVHNGRFGLLYLDQKGDVIGGPKRMGASFTCNCLRECDNNLVRMLVGLWWDEAAMMSSFPMSGFWPAFSYYEPGSACRVQGPKYDARGKLEYLPSS